MPGKVGRPRKHKAAEPTSPIVPAEVKEELTVDQVFDVLQFASEAYKMYGFPQAYTPDLVASRLKDVSLHPVQGTADKINAALLDPKTHEKELVGYSEFFELNSILYKRMLHYLSDMLAWNISYVCTNVKDEKDYTSPAYQKDLQVVSTFFDKMDIQTEFRMALREMIRRETYYSYFRNEGEKYVFQELPRERCKITARWDYGLVFDFDMQWFIQQGVDIEFYPPIFKQWYREIWGDKKANKPLYDPATGIDNRSSSWLYWHQTSPEQGFWAFKFSPEMIAEVPFFAPLFPDIVNQPIVRQLQQNSYMAMAAKLVTSTVPQLNKSVKGGSVGDNISITPETLGKFLNILRQAISSVINVAAMPTENIQALEFTGDKEMYDSWIQTSASLSGVNSRLIYSHERQNVLETQLSTDVDKYLLKPVYAMFQNFLDYEISKLTKKYKFKFTLWGTEFSNEKQSTLDQATSLANLGIVLPQRFAGALGMSPFDFERQLAEARAGKWVEKLTPIVSAFQQSAADKPTGRPSKDTEDLNDSGGDTRSAGSNLGKGGKQ